MVFRVAPEEWRAIFDDTVLGCPPVSQGNMGLSHLFNEETSEGTPDTPIAGHGLFCVQQSGSVGGSKEKS